MVRRRAPRLRDVDDLNRRARFLLQLDGAVDTDEVRLGGRGFAVGDEILALRNDYRAQILNGTTGAITAIDRKHRLLRLDCDGRGVVLPFAYAEAGDLTHGYATTLHKAQGATVDRSFVLADETYAREHLYTALSRGTIRNDLYIAPIDVDDEQHAPGPIDEREPAARVARRSAAQQLAIDHAGDRLMPIHVLEAERRRIVDGFRDVPDDPNIELREVQRRIGDRQRDRVDAVARHDRATTALDDLGIVGRRLHRQQRTDLERTIARPRTTWHEPTPTWRRSPRPPTS